MLFAIHIKELVFRSPIYFLGIIVQFSLCLFNILPAHVAFKATLNNFMSVMFIPPFWISYTTITFLLILSLFPFHIKEKNILLTSFRTNVGVLMDASRYTILEKARAFITTTHTWNVSSLQENFWSISLILNNFVCQVFNSVSSLLYPDHTASFFIIFLCQFIPEKLSFLFLLVPSHIPSVLYIFISKPDTFPNAFTFF